MSLGSVSVILGAYGAFSDLAARGFAVGFVEKLAALVDDKSWEKAVWSGHDAADLAIDRIEIGLKRFRKKRKNS